MTPALLPRLMDDPAARALQLADSGFPSAARTRCPGGWRRWSRKGASTDAAGIAGLRPGDSCWGGPRAATWRRSWRPIGRRPGTRPTSDRRSRSIGASTRRSSPPRSASVPGASGRRIASRRRDSARTPAIAGFLAAIEAGESPGGAAVAWGLAAAAMAIPERPAALGAAHAAALGLLTVGVRLGSHRTRRPAAASRSRHARRSSRPSRSPRRPSGADVSAVRAGSRHRHGPARDRGRAPLRVMSRPPIPGRDRRAGRVRQDDPHRAARPACSWPPVGRSSW